MDIQKMFEELLEVLRQIESNTLELLNVSGGKKKVSETKIDVNEPIETVQSN